MNKAQLVETVALNTKQTKADVNKTIESMLETITKTLKRGDRVNLVGFGVFKVTRRLGRIGRNPKTGEQVKIATKKVAKFKAGQDLAAAVKR